MRKNTLYRAYRIVVIYFSCHCAHFQTRSELIYVEARLFFSQIIGAAPRISKSFRPVSGLRNLPFISPIPSLQRSKLDDNLGHFILMISVINKFVKKFVYKPCKYAILYSMLDASLL